MTDDGIYEGIWGMVREWNLDSWDESVQKCEATFLRVSDLVHLLKSLLAKKVE